MIDASSFVAIDFDGTVTDVDIIDAVLQQFARPEWQEVEAEWERGVIGSRESLERQMAMIDQPLGRVLAYVDGFSIDASFKEFTRFLDDRRIRYAIVSDGFQVFIERLLANAGLADVPVFANQLSEEQGRLRTLFPYARPGCNSANCKCAAVSGPGSERSLIVIGDGRSDFCLARRACHVFTKAKLSGYCRENSIPYTPFDDFSEITALMRPKSARLAPLRTAEVGKD